MELTDAIENFRANAEELRLDLTSLENSVTSLESNCVEYIDYASDLEEEELVIQAKNSIQAFGKSTSVQQIDDIEKQIQKLEKMTNELKFVANKQAIKEQGLEQVDLIEKRFARMYKQLEEN